MTAVAVLQPGYLPWLGYFDQMRRVDVFVLYDDVQFDKHGWRNRNRIKCAHGAQWLSVPVRHHGQGRPRISDVEIDATKDWARKHILAVRQCYARAPHLEPYATELEQALSQQWLRLVDLDIELAAMLARWLGITTRVVRSSELPATGEKSERLVAICRLLGADRYLTGEAARDYLEVELFHESGIEVEWQNLDHPVYPQQHGAFVSHLSALDVILNCGEGAAAILAGTGTGRA